MSTEVKIGQKVRDVNGYVRIYKPDYYCADRLRFVSEHRFILEQQLGRHLLKIVF